MKMCPQVMNEIQDQNDDVTVQFDYIDRLQTNEHLQSYRNTYLSILIGTFVLTLVTILMLEWMYVVRGGKNIYICVINV